VCESSISETDDYVVNQKTAAIFIVLGGFECLAGLTSGYLLDRFDRYFMASVSTVMVEISIILSVLAYFEKNYTLCFFCAAMWGYTDCFI
jgi:predicted MFS family arabinose efflux permease